MKQQKCPMCQATGVHTFPCEEGTPVLVEEVVASTRGPAAKAMDDARRAMGIKVLFLADRTMIPYERLRDALRGHGALAMDEIERVLSALGLAIVKKE